MAQVYNDTLKIGGWKLLFLKNKIVDSLYTRLSYDNNFFANKFVCS